jgi:hypothetical protein
MNFSNFSDVFKGWVHSAAQLIQNEVQADIKGISTEVNRSGMVVRGHVQKAFFATAVVAFLYYVVEPYFGIGQTQVEGLLFLPLFLDFGVYTCLQFLERLLEPFVSWIARRTGLVWLYLKFGWVVFRPLCWAGSVALTFVRSLLANQEFQPPAYPTGYPQSAVSPDSKFVAWQRQWRVFRGNVSRAFAETAVTLVMYFAFSFLSGMNKHESFEIMVALPLYLQVFRYTVTQFLARIAEPYVIQVAAPSFPSIRTKLLAWGDSGLIGMQRGLSAGLHFLLGSSEEQVPPKQKDTTDGAGDVVANIELAPKADAIEAAETTSKVNASDIPSVVADPDGTSSSSIEIQ